MCTAISNAHIHTWMGIYSGCYLQVVLLIFSKQALWIYFPSAQTLNFCTNVQKTPVWHFVSGSFITVAFLFYSAERSMDGILLNEALCIHCNGSEQSFSASDASGSRWVLFAFCDDKFECVMLRLNGIFLRNRLYLWDDSFAGRELEILSPASNPLCFVLTEVLILPAAWSFCLALVWLKSRLWTGSRTEFLFW